MDGEFYAADVAARGLCDDWFGCEVFSPSAATLKVTPQDKRAWTAFRRPCPDSVELPSWMQHPSL